MKKQQKTSFRHTIINDFFEKDFWKTSKKDWTDTQDYYLSDTQKEQISQMGDIRKYFYIVYWIIRDMFLKLSANRRVMLVLSVISLLHYQHLAQNGEEDGAVFLILSTIGLLFVLMLELKDKLLAQDELNAGRAVQMAMMPKRLVETKNWQVWMFSRPALDVGGDIIDYHEMDDNRIGVSLGDISGKGLGAALLMVKLQATVRALADNNSDLSVLAQKVNKIYHKDKPKGSFASLVYAEPKEDGTIKYFNAGHLPPILYQDGIIKHTKSGSPALGILPSAKFRTEVCNLNLGDFFIMFSDGITEAMNKDGELYGLKRLENTIEKYKDGNIEELAQEILNDVMLYFKENTPNDDISLVIIKYNQV